jgi:hypothetical protein
MPDRKRNDPRALGRLRTRAWAYSVRRAYAKQTNANPHISFITLERRLGKERGEVFDKFNQDSRYLIRYARGDRRPDNRQLDLYEEEFPGTREVFECGPYGSDLWEAMRCRDRGAAQALRDKILHDIRTGIRAEIPVSVPGFPPGVQDVIVPASVLRGWGVVEADLQTPSETIARCLEQAPDLRHRLAPVVGAFSNYAAGALVTVQPGVTYSPDERVPCLPVTAPLLAGFVLELLEAQIREVEDGQLLLIRHSEYEMHLQQFGISLGDIESLTGFVFQRFPIVPAGSLQRVYAEEAPPAL